MMKNWSKIAILLIFCSPVHATNVDYDTAVTAWGVACRYLKNECKNISPPPIAWSDTIKISHSGAASTQSMLGWGGYNEKTRTIHLLKNIPDDKITGILIHEYVHHILHVTSEVEIIRNDVKSICESERQAFKVSHRWMRLNNRQHHVVKWKKYYTYCR